MWDLLLRETHRGGKKGAAQLAARFEAFRTGDHRQLIVWHVADSLALLGRQRPPSSQASEATKMKKVLHLVSEGELSKATGLMLSHGLADLDDPHCQAQMAAKHPPNPKLVQRSLADFGEAGSEPVNAPSLRDAIRCLEGHRGAGVDGCRNEFLRSIFAEGSPSSDRCIAQLDRCQTLHLEANLPAWCCQVANAKSLTGVHKNAATAAAPKPDARPVTCGQVLTRTI